MLKQEQKKEEGKKKRMSGLLVWGNNDLWLKG